MEEYPVLWPNTTARSAHGELTIGGCSLSELADQFGTPLYIFDEATLHDRADRVVRAFVSRYGEARVVFGGKAYLSPTIVRLFHDHGIGLDVVSGGEIYGGLRAGIPAVDMVFHGNNKTRDELRYGLEHGVGMIVVDNDDEIHRLEAIARDISTTQPDIGTKVPVMVRLNPGVDVHTHAKISTGIVDSKFGFPVWEDNARYAVELLAGCQHLELVGFHMHLGSQVSTHETMPVAVERQVAFAAEVRDRHGVTASRYSPGGGLSIAYTEDGVDADPEEWAEVIVSAYRAAWEKHDLPGGTIIAEPGRWLIGPAAVALYRVGSVKRIPGVRTYVAVDGGMADNIRPSMYDARYTAEIVNRNPTGATEQVRIAGRYCESGDVLIEDIALPRIAVDDLISLPAAGAYQLPMASNYNAVPRPAVVMVADGAARIIRRRETVEDVFVAEAFI
jgi:diaminopimelate decarboxylase